MADNNLIGRTIDNFRIERFLGQGGMAAVYEATDLRLQRQVALKVMHAHLASQQAFRDRFINEAQSAASLDHPNIVRVLTFNKEGNDLYLAMELIAGGNLRQYIKQLNQQGKYIDYPEAIEIVRQLAGALHYAHGRRMVHRDIKPDNIMLKPLQHEEGGLNYRPLITDFGLAKLMFSGEEDATAEQPIGTYPYMSPEQVNAEDIDHRTDIYAMGIMLYELSVGRLPYNPKTIAEAARMHLREPLPLPTELRRGFPIRLEEIIVKALEKDVENRYQSATAMAKALTSVSEEKKSNTVKLSRNELFSYMDQYDTDVQTSLMPEPLMPSPQSSPPEREGRDREYDCLYFTDGTNGFFHRLVRERTTIGRAKRQDIALESDFVSREHAVLERKPNGKYYLLDISDSNGTWTDEFKLKRDTPVILQPRTIFRIGNYWMHFLPKIEDLDKTEPPVDIAPPKQPVQAPPPPVQPVQQQPVIDTDPMPDEAEVEPQPPTVPTRPVEPPAPPTQPRRQQPINTDEMPAALSNQPPRVEQETISSPVPSNTGMMEAPTLSPMDSRQLKEEIERQQQAIRQAVPDQPPGDQPPVQEMDGDATQLSGIVPLYEMPRDEPPALTPAQFAYDRLVVFHKGERPRLILLEHNNYTFGRDPSNDIVFNSPYVSRFHAQLELENRFYYVSDLGSTNGTWFDNERLDDNAPARLNASKVMRIGDYWLTFEARRDVGGGIFESDINEEEYRETYDDTIETAVMVREIEEDMPHYSDPPLSNEIRESDRLVFYSDDHPMKIVPIAKETMTIGRGSTQDVQLDGKRVSREHAILEVRRDGNLYLRDVNSTNGVWIADTLLVPDTNVQWGRNEIVRIGNYWLKFEKGVKLIDPGTLQDNRGLIGKTVGNYRIDRYIGQSAISAVYKATDLQLNRDVSLRILDPQLAIDNSQRQRFLEEARILSRLDHPNIVKVMSYNRADNEVFMVMELITGGSLRAVINGYIDRGAQMELRDAVDLVIQLANGLHFAHQQGLIHRDVKPENIVLKTSGVVGPLVKYTPVLTDFSISRYARTDDIFDDDGNTAFAYISPETCLGERTDIRSDIYELGVVLFELLSGRTPYNPVSIAEAIRMHTREAIPRVSERRPNIPLDLEAIVTKTLQKSPNDRYQTGIDLARALQRILPVLDTDEASVASLSASEDINITQIMSEPIARAMPLLTHPPRPEGEIDHDRLVFYSDQYPTKVFDLDKPIFTIGRGEDQDIFLESTKVSRRHARIERSPDNIYRIVDIGSTNGSWLGSYKLIENVLEIWDLDETVRLADYWIRIESKEELNGAFLLPEPEDMPDEFDDEEPELIGPPAIHHPAPAHDRIQVKTNTAVVTVLPGSTATMSVEVINLSDFVDHFHVEAVGLPPDWVTQPSLTLDLLPNNRETTSITFHPPLASTSSEGHHAFEVRVTAEAKGISAVRTQCSLTILPYFSYQTSIYPDRLRNKGKVELSIHNTSNTFSTFTLEARDREQGLHFQLEGKQYALPPGYTESIIIGVDPLSRHWFGQQRVYPYEVIVTPVPQDRAGGSQTQRGDVTVFPRLRVWYFVVLFILLLLCALITAATLFITNQNRVAAILTETSVDATSQVLTVTAMADGDDDGDGLGNTREKELGTDPNLADTDQDGLTDREEVLQWKTDPLNRDTDNDTLSDGDEVLNGTNPNNEDTDGDGILDPYDPFPNQLATPTITPFPTIAGSGGDICPGSPVPSRVAIGMQAVVEPGGVANRIRAEPSFNNGEIVGFMQPEETFIIIGGPTCDEETQLRYWQIDYKGIIGWTAEGEGEEYYIKPPGEDSEEGGETTDGNTTADAQGNSPTTADLNSDESEAMVAVANTHASLIPPGQIAISRDNIGIQLMANVNSQTMSRSMDGIAPLNMGWVKLQVSWEALQPSSNEVTPELMTLQSHISTIKSRGHRVLLSVVKAPTWARSTSVEDGPPDNLDDLQAFLEILLELSGNNIDAIEVWNEPNILREWNTEAYPFTGSGYMRLFDRAYVTIRNFSPNITVVTAGLAPTGNSAVSVQDRKFLRQMYNAGLASYDNVAIGVHPFGWGNPPDVICCDPFASRDWDDQPQFFFLNTVATYNEIAKSYGHNTELWLTEFGWSTWNDLPLDPPEPWMNYLTTDEQISNTIRAFEIGQSLEYVGPMFLWNFNFANEFNINNRDEMVGYSLVISDENSNFQPRALYEALSGS